ncbi:hypothetical protein KsCSTR_16800 [Candidatus Kuenenia stuttgartiensis]|uniref:Uncharacterized protein n=1 Tax=Kuenenia stuttgartiensis TaxID=174633 RepID=Q1Q1Y3_KUEST|nr:hypothetical protein KsCSTR_16800 [Candidatus Kuenenia stuttgartiensis]CAJ74027.1 unknown protein [Candidatus Kuenenia stuttgartiensis]
MGPRLQTNVIKLSDRPQKSPLIKGDTGLRSLVNCRLPTVDCRRQKGPLDMLPKKCKEIPDKVPV